MTDKISLKDFLAADGVSDWRITGEGALTFFRTGSFAAGARLVQAIDELEGVAAHPPAVDVRGDGVTVRLVTREAGTYGLSERDLDLARAVSAAAAGLGFVADASLVQHTQIAIDAQDIAGVLPFWRAVLGYEDRDGGGEDLIDPRGRGPMIWFQGMDAPRPQRNRVHLDVFVAPEVAEARVAAALAAGGRLVSDVHAPDWWTLADAEGNEVDVATITG
jgi:4a-hydroxytetrahydrobiopterin dehydratase